jgi:hypothetical protein
LAIGKVSCVFKECLPMSSSVKGGEELAESEKDLEELGTSKSFWVVRWRNDFKKRQCSATLPGMPAKLGVNRSRASDAQKGWLEWSSQAWFQSQDFLLGRNPPRYAAFHDPSQLLASAQLEQAILGELLVGQTVQGGLVNMPSPGQHFISQIFIAGTIIGFLFAQQIPQRY